MAFDLMGRDTADDWQVVAERLALVPQGLSSIEAALSEGAAQGIVAARRQAVACTKQADTWGGRDPATRPFFLNLVDEYDASGLGDHAFRDRLEQLAERATAAYAALGRFLVEEYAPHATERDPVGRERYALYSQDFNGIDARSRRDVRVGLGGAAPHRTRDGAGRRADHPRSRRRHGHRAPRDRPDARHRGGRRVPPVESGAARSHRRRARRRALRHPRRPCGASRR